MIPVHREFLKVLYLMILENEDARCFYPINVEVKWSNLVFISNCSLHWCVKSPSIICFPFYKCHLLDNCILCIFYSIAHVFLTIEIFQKFLKKFFSLSLSLTLVYFIYLLSKLIFQWPYFIVCLTFAPNLLSPCFIKGLEHISVFSFIFIK